MVGRPDGVIDFCTLRGYRFGSPPADARCTSADRTTGREIFRLLECNLPSRRGWIAWIRRSGKIACGIVQTYCDQMLLVEKPRKLKYTIKKGYQQRQHHNAFN